ncbi:MAG: transporter [Firmicutes bacterium HGW-Firmicutes-1]|nr:MAG: transporter [Firmicutes bacterium HGW-Firmicutes-1]
MIRDITIGQYYPSDSIIHRLDPRTKIIATFIYICSLFINIDFIGYFATFVFISSVIYTSKVPLSFILKGLKAIVVIIVLTISINIFFTPGKTILVDFWIIKITLEGVILAILMGIRLILLIIGSSLLTLTTSPISLTDGIETLLKPMEKIRVPAHEIAMMMTIALRFIPILLEETDKIMKAQTARGAEFEEGSIVKRARSLIPLLVPLFISSFRRAEDLALAMEARCYKGGEGRTKMHQLKYFSKDYMTFLISIAYVGILIMIRLIWGS